MSILQLVIIVGVTMGLRFTEAEVRGYCPCKTCCGENATGRTSSGNDAYSKGLAVPQHGPVPLGAMLYVPGYGWCTADDHTAEVWRDGSKLKVEVRFPKHGSAEQWEMKKLRIAVSHLEGL